MSMKDFVNTLNEEQRKALLAALSDDTNITLSHVDKATKEETKTIINEDFVMNKSQNTSGKRKEPVKARQNQWVDTGEFKDITTPEVARTPRNRQSPKKVQAKCYVCGKGFEADSRFVFGEFHRCDRCK